MYKKIPYNIETASDDDHLQCLVITLMIYIADSST